jgi:NTP pyrophosphatase (non-canonical NTP hydrolase)
MITYTSKEDKEKVENNIKELVALCHGKALDGGWWHDLKTGERLQRNKGELIALMHSELSEALEGIRKNLNDDHLPNYKSEEVELADLLIRVFDYCGAFELKVAEAFIDKIEYNSHRADHKPENRIKENGKAF